MGIVVLITCRTSAIFVRVFQANEATKTGVKRERDTGEGAFAAYIMEAQSGYRHDVLSKKHYSVVVLLLYLIAW